jgi:hypothetical protein
VTIETGRGLTVSCVDDPELAHVKWGNASDDPRFGAAPDGCRWSILRGTSHGWLRGEHDALRGFGLVGADGRAHLVPGLRDGFARVASVSDAGALVAWDPEERRARRLYRVALDAEPVAVWTAEADITALTRVSDGWLVATMNQLVVLRDEAPRLAIASERRSRPSAWLAAVRDGTCVLIGRDNDTEVWGYHDGGLTQLDALDAAFAAPREIDGKIVFWSGNDVFELDGLDALLETWQAKRKPTRKVAKRTGALSLEPTDAALEPVVHVCESAEGFDSLAKRRVFESPASGRTVAIDDAQGALVWIDASGGQVRESVRWGNAQVTFSPRGDEVIAFQGGFATLVHVDLVAGVATHQQLTVDRKEVRDAVALGGGRVLAVLAKTLQLRGPSGVLEELLLAKCTKVHLVRDDVAVLACDVTGKKTRVLAIAGDRLFELGAFAERMTTAGRVGSEVAIATIDGDRMIVRGIEVPVATAPPQTPPSDAPEAPVDEPTPSEAPIDEPMPSEAPIDEPTPSEEGDPSVS